MKQIRERNAAAGLLLCAITTSGLLTALPATAIEFRSGQHVTVGAEEVILDDLYATGETVTVDGRVEGDVIASGREIRLNGEVTGDLIAAGQAVIVNGVVGDDVRMAGMSLQLGPGASVGDDIVSAGFSLETFSESVTQGSLLFAGFQALLAGDISESLLGSMTAIEIRGGVGGDSKIKVDGDSDMPSFAQYLPSPVTLPAVAGGLTITDTANFDGEFEYTSRAEARGEGAGSENLTHVKPAPPAVSPEAEPAVSAEAKPEPITRRPSWPGKLIKWVGLIVLGLILAWLIPGWLNARSGEIQAKPAPMAGLGLLGVAALPVGIALALGMLIVLTVILGLLKLGNLAALTMVLGLVLVGLLLLLFWVTFAYLAPILVGLCTGRWILGRFAADKASGLVLPLIAGLVLLALLRLVPFLGFLVALIVLCLGWGAILFWLWKRSRAEESAAV